MHGPAITVIVDRDQPADTATALARRALDAWPTPGRPDLVYVGVDQFLADEAPIGPGIAWLIFSSVDSPQLFEMIGRIEERWIPAMLTCGDETESAGGSHGDGVLICPPPTDPELACLMLRSLWSQSPTMAALRSELRLVHAQQGGLVDQIGKFDEELRLAAQLQREFLPTELPQVGDVSFDVLFRPAGYVSGDIYDVQRLDENHIGFFVADAMGHGVPAALLTMYIKRSLRTKKLLAGSERGHEIVQPAEALAKLNQDMVERQAGQVRFATACYGIVDCVTRSMILARAGHPFPILLRANGATETLRPEGSLLGVFPDESFEQATIGLGPGDRMLIYSDGFEMAFPDLDDKKRVANTRFEVEFEQLRHGPLDQALERLNGSLSTQAGSLNQRDDLTVLCLEIKKKAAASAA